MVHAVQDLAVLFSVFPNTFFGFLNLKTHFIAGAVRLQSMEGAVGDFS